MAEQTTAIKPHHGKTVYAFDVPVYVTVEDGRVTSVIIDDTTDVHKPRLIEGENLKAAVAASLNGQDWPSWEWIA